MSLNQIMADCVEELLEMELDGQGTLHADTLREKICDLHEAGMARSVMLQRFVAMAQERTWPSIETINEARQLMGLPTIAETRTI